MTSDKILLYSNLDINIFCGEEMLYIYKKPDLDSLLKLFEMAFTFENNKMIQNNAFQVAGCTIVLKER